MRRGVSCVCFLSSSIKELNSDDALDYLLTERDDEAKLFHFPS